MIFRENAVGQWTIIWMWQIMQYLIHMLKKWIQQKLMVHAVYQLALVRYIYYISIKRIGWVKLLRNK